MSVQFSDLVADLRLPATDVDGDAGEIQAVVLALFDECASELLRYTRSFGLDRQEAEDVVQDAFVALFRHLCLGRDRTNLRGWLFRVVQNLALKHRTARARHRVPADHAGALVEDACADPSPDPEQRLLGSERQRTLRSVFEALPVREQECLYLRAEGHSYRDIAATLRVSLGTVARAMGRAVSRLMRAGGDVTDGQPR